eukprot:TRINITY_DN9073_c0_g1_i1.p1 TRINITY_DN9073_c0_g1~~TRINITY_DN9073_c0_g1_i1.p1  ORF type:complete len:636 (+),score=134.05 TRINITY_DN9073_c0_g1_i1:136-1908(+)
MASMMGFSTFGVKEESAEEKQAREAKLLEKRKRSFQSVDESKATSSSTTHMTVDNDDNADGQAEEQSEEEDDDDQSTLGMPISHEVTLQHGTKPVSALTLDPNGSRLVTGGYDYQLKLWDFNGMDAALRAFRSTEPHEGYPIRALAFSATGDKILVCTGKAQPKVVDRDGTDISECLRGDIYIYDSAKTHGHVALVNSGSWHPKEKTWFLTGSTDSTVRVWDVDDHKKSRLVGKCRSKTGRRVAVNTCQISRDGKLLVAGCEDGAIHLFRVSKTVIRHKTQMQEAHEGGEVTCVAFARDSDRIVSRGTDGTVKMWTASKLKSPTLVAKDLPCFYNCTDVVWSPDEKFILTGTSGSDDFQGALVILRAKNLQPAYRVGVGCRGVLRVLWHLKINQIVLGCADGNVKVLFDPVKSDRGAKLCATRAPRKADPLDMQFGNLNSAALDPYMMEEMRKGGWMEKRSAGARKAMMRKDAVASRMPERPIESERGVGKQGRTLSYSGSISQYVAKRAAYDPTRDSDPREALLKYADVAETDPQFVNKAYSETQPKTLYNFEALEQEEDKEKPDDKKPKYDPEYKKKQYIGSRNRFEE